MKTHFQLSSGSTVGREHRLIGKNNQDALAWFQSDSLTIGVVCDGCSSGQHSEVGAQLGARLLVERLARLFASNLTTEDEGRIHKILERARQDVLAHVRILALALGGSLSHTVSDYFLFTIVGFIITPNLATTFSLGDGLLVVNGEITQLGPFPHNEPPYLAYALVESSMADCDSDFLRFHCHHVLPVDQVTSLLVGSDGVADVIDSSDQLLPGKTEPAGSLSQFWNDSSYYQNPDALRRRLFLMNREMVQPDWPQQRLRKSSGLLPDDTTLIVARRRG